MGVSFENVFIAVVALILMAVPGFLLAKFKLLPKKAVDAFSALVLYGCQPFLIFMAFQKHYDSKVGINMLIVAGLAIVVHSVMIGIVYLFIRNKDKQSKINCVRFASVFSNCGFMGFPFLQMLFTGELLSELLIYGAMILVVFNLMSWTIGVFIISGGDRKLISVKKVVLNPVVIAVVLGLILFFAVGTPLNELGGEGTFINVVLEKIIQSFEFLGDMVTPLSMIVIGVKLASINLKTLFLDVWSYVACGLKLVVMPIIATLLVAFLPIDAGIKTVVFMLLSMPSATSTALFAVKFGGDGDSATSIVLLTTILSIVTIPLMYLLFSAIVV